MEFFEVVAQELCWLVCFFMGASHWSTSSWVFLIGQLPHGCFSLINFLMGVSHWSTSSWVFLIGQRLHGCFLLVSVFLGVSHCSTSSWVFLIGQLLHGCFSLVSVFLGVSHWSAWSVYWFLIGTHLHWVYFRIQALFSWIIALLFFY